MCLQNYFFYFLNFLKEGDSGIAYSMALGHRKIFIQKYLLCTIIISMKTETKMYSQKIWAFFTFIWCPWKPEKKKGKEV